MGIDAEMLVKVNGNVTDDQLRRWSYIFGSAFHNHLFLGYDENIYHKPLERVVGNYEQDGPDVQPLSGETFIRVSVGGRYYGIGYERGPLTDYIIMAEFIEALIPNCTVWYGGDSSGVCLELFDKNKRDELLKYYTENGRDRYNRAFDKDNDGPDCPSCEVKMVRNGWGNNYKLFTCLGCGWIIREKDGIVTRGFNLKM